MGKIVALHELSEILNAIRQNENKKIIHCHGVFDLLHIGHIRYFEQARQMGDVLVVTLTSDQFVDKGPQRPAFPEILRAEAIASLEVVDYVAINSWPTAEETIRLLRPDIYVKGSEYKKRTSDFTGKIEREEKVVKEIGATLAFTEDIVFSSTNLINRYFSHFSDEIQQYLQLFRNRYKHEDIFKIIDSTSNLNVLVIGDSIIDDYQYCTTIGKSSKDPMLALKYESNDIFVGGVIAVANHVSSFVKHVQLVTVLGEYDSYESFIKTQLHSNVTIYYETQDKAPTIVKKRFIDVDSLNKLFEVYTMDDSGLSNKKNKKICQLLKNEISKYDLVIVADFGHGMVSKDMITVLRKHSKYLAVNTQANAGNRGFHSISKYPLSDYVCIAEHELRLEMRDLKTDIRTLMNRLMNKIECTMLVVTSGRNGCAVLYKNDEFVKIPAFTGNIVDRIGAGDAFNSFTALLAAMNVNFEIIGFLGNVVGALAVEILGNKKSIDKQSVKNFVVSLLK